MTDNESYEQKVNAELDLIQAELDKLRAAAGRAKAEQRIRFDRYLRTLEKRKDDISDKLSGASEDTMNEIKRSLAETWDRLKIARKAAEARFH